MFLLCSSMYSHFFVKRTLCIYHTNREVDPGALKKKCIDRESNSGPYLGKVRCYHYTTNAILYSRCILSMDDDQSPVRRDFTADCTHPKVVRSQGNVLQVRETGRGSSKLFNFVLPFKTPIMAQSWRRPRLLSVVNYFHTPDAKSVKRQ